MKSNKEQLEKRGFLSKDFDLTSCELSLEEKLRLLESKIPTERTLAARLLKNETATVEIIDCLINALAKEKKLYPKIEISNTLENFGKPIVKSLITMLGKIGTNQHKVVPEKEFKKDNYPLPRDIAARIIAHIGNEALPDLVSHFATMCYKKKTEAIDAIGYICFYNDNPKIYKLLKACYKSNKDDELIKWKLLRAFSSFHESEVFLRTEKGKLQRKRLQLEIDRSISLIIKRKGKYTLR